MSLQTEPIGGSYRVFVRAVLWIVGSVAGILLIANLFFFYYYTAPTGIFLQKCIPTYTCCGTLFEKICNSDTLLPLKGSEDAYLGCLAGDAPNFQQLPEECTPFVGLYMSCEGDDTSGDTSSFSDEAKKNAGYLATVLSAKDSILEDDFYIHNNQAESPELAFTKLFRMFTEKRAPVEADQSSAGLLQTSANEIARFKAHNGKGCTAKSDFVHFFEKTKRTIIRPGAQAQEYAVWGLIFPLWLSVSCTFYIKIWAEGYQYGWYPTVDEGELKERLV